VVGKKEKGLALGVAALLAAPGAFAIDVERLDVQRLADRYVVEFHARLAAPAEQVGEVLTDYAHYPELDPRIQEMHRDETDHSRLHTRLRGCLGGLMCRTLQRVETLEEHPGEVIATTLPTEGDVRYGITHSRWEASGTGTQIDYRFEITPDFWVPPLIGPRLMIKALREGTLSLFTNVEREALVRAGKHE
jgi:hypothetical protein